MCAYKHECTMEPYQAIARRISPWGKKYISHYRDGKLTELLNHLVIRKKIGNEAVFNSEFNVRLNNIRGWIEVAEQKYIQAEIDDLPAENVSRWLLKMAASICGYAEMLRKTGVEKSQLKLVYEEALRASRLIKGKNERGMAIANAVSEMVKANLLPEDLVLAWEAEDPSVKVGGICGTAGVMAAQEYTREIVVGVFSEAMKIAWSIKDASKRRQIIAGISIVMQVTGYHEEFLQMHEMFRSRN